MARAHRIHSAENPAPGGTDRLSILVVDDDADFLRTCVLTLLSLGHSAEGVSSAEDALARLRRSRFDVVLLDILLGETNGLQALKEIRASHPGVEIVMMSGHASVNWAVEAMRSGAADYLVKPFGAEDLARALLVASRTGDLARETRRLRRALQSPPPTLVGRSRAMAELRRLVRRVAPSDVSVLILGESGTGKEVVARAIHAASPRRDEPFVAVDCAAIAPTLIESELFGHVKGAFTGADRDREGLIGAADRGTLFLDEIGEMPPEAQARLLRVLEAGELRPVGATALQQVDVRVIAATNRDLEKDLSFRRDLFFRLNVVTIRLPPLRERKEDIALLAEHFLARHRRSGSICESVSADAMSALKAYSWPGNVRELENVIERCCALAPGLRIERSDLPPSILFSTAEATAEPVAGTGLPTLQDVRREAIRKALEAAGYDRAKAARILGIDRSTLYRNMRKWGLSVPGRRASK